MKQWCPLYVFLYSYCKFAVIVCTEVVKLNLTTTHLSMCADADHSPYKGLAMRKCTHHLDTISVEILAFFGNLGQCAALPTGIFLQNSGPRLALCTAIVFIVPSYLLLWNAEKYQVYYHSHVGLIAFYFFCIGRLLTPRGSSA